MKIIIPLFAVLFCTAFVNSTPNVSLSGTITDGNGAAINGARLNLKNFPLLVWKTNTSGSFVGTQIVSHPVQGNSPQMSVRNNALVFKTGTVTRHAAIEVLNSRGIRVSHTEFFNLASGSHRVPLFKGGCGVYFIRVSLDNRSSVYRMITGIAGRLSSGAAGRAQSQPQINETRNPASSYVDTLIVVANGFKHALIPLSSYTIQNIKCSLSVSNPWKPTGSPEHFKNMVKILAKNYNFEMGQPDPNLWGDTTGAIAEQQVHTVAFTYDFYIDSTEVTQADFDTVMKMSYPNYQKPDWQAPYGVGSNFPAYYIEWGDAALYCNARSKRDGYDTVYKYTEIIGIPGLLCILNGLSCDLSKNGYRLPTESEWEYVCRAGASTDFFWGKNYKPYPSTSADTVEIGSLVIWRVNSWDLGESSVNFGTHLVATKKPNTYGLYDINGNVSEFCNDYWTTSYPFGTVVDPIGGPDTTDFRTIRGGNWGNDASHLRSSNRYFFAPNYEYFFKGFRVAKRVL
jgi:formylglycine-generating enzyme required for sulfatase activity